MENLWFLRPSAEFAVTCFVAWRLFSFFNRRQNLLSLFFFAWGSFLFFQGRLLDSLPFFGASRGILEAVVLGVLVLNPEIKKLFSRIFKRNASSLEALRNGVLEELVKSCEILSESRTGALLAIERHDNLSSYVRTSVEIDAKIRHELLLTIFTPPTYVHDGGVIIRQGRLAACSAIFPLSSNPRLQKDLGTRHRAALGMSEETDALCLVISEETGTISAADQGKLYYDLEPAELKENLKRLLYFKKIKPRNYLETGDEDLRPLSLDKKK